MSFENTIASLKTELILAYGKPQTESTFRSPESQSKISRKIENVVWEILKSVAEYKPPTLRTIYHTDWKNCFFDDRVKLSQVRKKPRSVQFRHRKSRPTFSNIVFLLSKIHKLLLTRQTSTRRELFYENIHVFSSQLQLDLTVRDVCYILGVPSWELGVVATSKGIVSGPLELKLTNGEIIDCNKNEGVSIPLNITQVDDIYSTATWILIIEKDAAFQKLLTVRPTKLESCIIITGKGYPDVNTRILVSKLWYHLKIPTFVLVDADPHGFEIMCVYRFGSATMSSYSKHLACPAVRWLGVHPADIDPLLLDAKPLSLREVDKIQKLLNRSYIAENEQFVAQLNILLKGNRKAEIESVSGISTNYMTDVYLRNKIQVTCSVSSLPSPPNTTLQTRKRSRTSSAGGDCIEISKDTKHFPNVSDRKGKARAAKKAARPAPKNAKTSGKSAKGKALKPTTDSLQNTIVLAPFYTLKKSFQSKLMELYSREKVKKINHKMKMAKKQNMTFAYDVMELKGVGKKEIKKGAKVQKKTKKEAQPRKVKSRSQSYCQCPRRSPKLQIIAKNKPIEEKPLKQRTRKLKSSLFGLGDTESKKRKLEDSVLASTMYADLGLGFVDTLASSQPSDSNPSISDLSSRSRADSWETLSDSPGGERLKGSLALSTTSFDSCLEAPKKKKARLRTRLKTVRESQKDGPSRPLLLKPKTDQSIHVIGGENTKGSDGQIIDFMDREPQTRALSTGTSEHIQPLRGQRRQTKKKAKETDAPKLYRLRSAKSVQENILKDSEVGEKHELPSPPEETEAEAKRYHVEVETQIEKNVTKDTDIEATSVSQAKEQLSTHTSDIPQHTKSSSSRFDVPESSDLKTKETISVSSTKIDRDDKTLEVLHCRNAPAKGADKEDTSAMSTPLSTPEKEETLMEVEPGDEFLGVDEVEVPEGQEKAPQGTSLCLGFSQPQDKVSDFIFGTGNSTARLGESCEFTFGLNWNFSDEEDSEHGDHFF